MLDGGRRRRRSSSPTPVGSRRRPPGSACRSSSCARPPRWEGVEAGTTALCGAGCRPGRGRRWPASAAPTNRPGWRPCPCPYGDGTTGPRIRDLLEDPEVQDLLVIREPAWTTRRWHTGSTSPAGHRGRCRRDRGGHASTSTTPSSSQADWLAGAWQAVAQEADRDQGVDADRFLAALERVAAEGTAAGGIIDRALAEIGPASSVDPSRSSPPSGPTGRAAFDRWRGVVDGLARAAPPRAPRPHHRRRRATSRRARSKTSAWPTPSTSSCCSDHRGRALPQARPGTVPRGPRRPGRGPPTGSCTWATTRTRTSPVRWPSAWTAIRVRTGEYAGPRGADTLARRGRRGRGHRRPSSRPSGSTRSSARPDRYGLSERIVTATTRPTVIVRLCMSTGVTSEQRRRANRTST